MNNLYIPHNIMLWIYNNHEINTIIEFYVIFQNIHIEQYDNDTIYEIQPTNTHIHPDKSITCEIKIIDNMINYQINKTNYTFTFLLHIDEQNIFHYTYTTINNNEFPYIDKYDYQGIIYMELKKQNNVITVKEKERLYTMHFK